MAQLYRDKVDDQDRAVELFNEALDLNPSYLEAFERINKILTAQKDWKQLERAYRKMLHRCRRRSANPDLEFNLWHNLGLIYRDRLQRHRTAPSRRSRWRRASSRTRSVERQILAELYEATDQLEAAIGEHALVLQKDPLRVDPYRSLYKLYLQEARLRPRVVHVRGARVPAQGRRGGAALLRGLPPAGDDPGEEPARQRAVGEEPLPQGREPLHRQDLRDDHARGARREDRRSSRAQKQLPGARHALPAGSGDEDGHVREDVRLGGAGARRPAARSSTCATTCPARSSPCRRRPPASRRRADGAHRLHAAGAHVHRRQAPRRRTAASTTSRTCSRRSPS